ncbi:hypothetical protein ER596_23715 [Salmonella enterica subsp. enterica serovar Havana]|nr:hypothetical protein [Salmonella enterica subsp. enterica serovar Havana]EBQ7149301.1 hypothetical protein [Salmonella enterica]MDX4799643.1 hypothetical protein [Klebsiella pneumoniae]EBH9588201.1 hypothetical protein [Salmonella enterica subsp. enterica serovar Havana]EBH9597820.1 hypothetical protein [Salmonella enterica subsp. enterica serovar Havana]
MSFNELNSSLMLCAGMFVIVQKFRYSPSKTHLFLEGAMSHSQDKRAWNRGVRLAGIWKRVTANLLKWDKKCVVWAKAHRLKSWMGHIPLLLTIICSLAALIAGGLIVSGSAVLLWSLIALVTQSGSSSENSTKNIFNENNNKNNFHDEFVMNSAINNEYDGAPYKSPSED